MERRFALLLLGLSVVPGFVSCTDTDNNKKLFLQKPEPVMDLAMGSCPKFAKVYDSCSATVVGDRKALSPESVRWYRSPNGEIYIMRADMSVAFGLKQYSLKTTCLTDNVEREIIATDPDYGFYVPEFSAQMKVVKVKKRSYCAGDMLVDIKTLTDPDSKEVIRREFRSILTEQGDFELQGYKNGELESMIICKPEAEA